MPASKSKARLSKPFPLVDLNDEIPSALIEALVALRASDSNNTLREPPSKRAKLSRDDPFPAYLITRQTLSILVFKATEAVGAIRWNRQPSGSRTTP
ncbi:hypothetical protein HYQ45_005899 [Verticillium longisporum]|uniref:Uncharacterized protein n=1 Tax=Verticillium longisporum TaxID=100787 RepID=A0A8I2ZPZ4_VERLO|nr:hypothetical protein HYQ45_005899 [Verticillium longisporum]